MTQRMSREVVWAVSLDVGNRAARKAERSSWSIADYDLFVAEFCRLWPAHLDGAPAEHCGCADCGGS